MVKILLSRGVEALLKWVDDFIFFCYPKSRTREGQHEYMYTDEIIWSMAKELGWPWVPLKFKPFDYTFLYIGFLWDVTKKQVSLPEPKKEKYTKKLAGWSKGTKMNLEDTESMIGTLNHVCLVVPQGHAQMPAFYKFRSSFKTLNWHIKHTIAQALHDDVKWWKDTLQQQFIGINIITPKEPIDLSLMVDASMSWGIGLVINGKWLAWELKQGWCSEGREIGWAEMVAIELALLILKAVGYKDCHIILQSDNQGIVEALRAGYS